MNGAVRANDIEMRYDSNGEGAPVVLLHGFPFNRTMWREQVEALAGEGFRMITPDLRGHGETELGSTASTMEQMASDVSALLDGLNITERIVLGGLSMGGYVTPAFYRLFHERVRALILADTRPQPDTDEARRTREETARRALDEGMENIADAMLPKLLAPATLAEKPDVVERVRSMILATHPDGAAAALRGMAVRREQTDLLLDINVPTLILVGSEDALTPPKDSETMQRTIKGSRMQVIEGAGHVSNIERAEEFNLALADFWRGLAA